MTASIEDRLRVVEQHQAVTDSLLVRIEADLKDIASSSNAIKDVVTGWKGGMGALIMVGGILMVAISGTMSFIMSRFFK
jgi:hypothetical protein